jgi:hypothetical protein
MDQPKYTTPVETLTILIDPRKARGKRYPWILLLTLIAIAIASGQRTVRAIADWFTLHWEELQAELHPARATCPSESAFRRVMRLIDPQGLEVLLSNSWTLSISPASPRIRSVHGSMNALVLGSRLIGSARER